MDRGRQYQARHNILLDNPYALEDTLLLATLASLTTSRIDSTKNHKNTN